MGSETANKANAESIAHGVLAAANIYYEANSHAIAAEARVPNAFTADARWRDADATRFVAAERVCQGVMAFRKDFGPLSWYEAVRRIQEIVDRLKAEDRIVIYLFDDRADITVAAINAPECVRAGLRRRASAATA